MAHTASMIFTSSNYSKSEIINFYSVKEPRISVIYLGLSPLYKPLESRAEATIALNKFNISQPYLLYSGNFKPHKNVSSLIHAFTIVRDLYPKLQLVLAGRKDSHYFKLEPLIQSSTCSNDIIVTDYLTLDEQRLLYGAAELFVMPSLYEGFGYPPLEAMACGTPVVSSNATSLEEIVADSAFTVDAKNPPSLAKAITTILGSDQTRLKLIESGLINSRRFSQENYARSLYNLISTVYEKNNR